MKQASTALAELFCNFRVPADEMEPKILAYVQTVKDESLPDIEAGVLRFRRGEVPGHDVAFCPTGAQFYREVRFQSQIRGIREKGGNIVALVPPKSKFLRDYEAKKQEG